MPVPNTFQGVEPSDEDFERAIVWCRPAIAQLLAKARAEQREADARICDAVAAVDEYYSAPVAADLAQRIREQKP